MAKFLRKNPSGLSEEREQEIKAMLRVLVTADSSTSLIDGLRKARIIHMPIGDKTVLWASKTQKTVQDIINNPDEDALRRTTLLKLSGNEQMGMYLLQLAYTLRALKRRETEASYDWMLRNPTAIKATPLPEIFGFKST